MDHNIIPRFVKLTYSQKTIEMLLRNKFIYKVIL